MGTVLSVMACLVPLLITPHLLFYFDVTPKAAVLLLGAAVVVPWAALRGSGSLLARRSGRWLSWLLLAQAISVALATLFSSHPSLSIMGTNWRRFGAVPQLALLLFTLAVAAYFAANPHRLSALLAAIAATGSIIALYGALQYFGWDPWLPAHSYHVGEGIWTIVRPPGTLGYASYLANYLLYVVFAGAALALLAKGGPARALGIAAAGLASSAIVLSGTRAAILGLAVGMAFLAIWLRPSWKRAAAIAAIVFACGTAFYFSPAGQMLRSRTRWYVEDPAGGSRLMLWRDSLAMARHYLAAGAGIETFSTEFPRYQSAALAAAFPEYYHESPHNIFLDALISQGLPGCAVLVLLSALAFYAAWQARTSTVAGALAAGFAAGLVSQLFTCFTVPTALYFYLTLALLVGQPIAVVQPPKNPANWLLFAASLPLALLFAVFAIRLLGADSNLELVRQNIDQGKVQDAAELYRRVRKWEPDGMSADLWYSRAMAAASKKPPLDAAISAWQQGLEAAIRATELAEDRQNAWYNLAAFYASQNDFARTEQSLRAAIDCAPNWFKPHWMLAQVLREQGRLKEAGAEAARAVALNGGKNPEVAQTFREIQARLMQHK